MKLTLIMLTLITSLMAVVGTFLTASVTSFYINAFYRQMDGVFGVDQREFVADLRRAAGETDGAELLREMLESNVGPLGIDYRSRNYFILDGRSGEWLAGSAGAEALPRTQSPNLLTARLAARATPPPITLTPPFRFSRAPGNSPILSIFWIVRRRSTA